MWKIISAFSVPGKPFGKQRPRHMRNGHTYTPKETTEYENLVKLFYSQSMHPKEPTDKAVKMVLVAKFPIPTSWSKKKQREVIEKIIPYTSKSDIDNCLKIVMDALNGIAYKDDAQISEAVVAKVYSTTPCMSVVLQEWDDEEES